MKKECIILAGGLGTRLQSVVNDVPKCMADVAGVPFLHHIFNFLEKERFQHIVLALGYKAEIITAWLNTQNRDFKITYLIEDKALGTGGAIQLAFSKIEGSQALVLNGDTFFEIDTHKFVASHSNVNADISIALKPMAHFDRYGSVECDESDRIIKFNEKQELEYGLINGGVYFIDKRIFSKLDNTEEYSFEKDILEKKIESLAIYGTIFDDYFVDIGIPSDFEKANIDFRKRKQI